MNQFLPPAENTASQASKLAATNPAKAEELIMSVLNQLESPGLQLSIVAENMSKADPARAARIAKHIPAGQELTTVEVLVKIAWGLSPGSTIDARRLFGDAEACALRIADSEKREAALNYIKRWMTARGL